MKNNGLFYAVGFHRYIVENLNDVTSNNLVEREVEEFDPPSEVCKDNQNTCFFVASPLTLSPSSLVVLGSRHNRRPAAVNARPCREIRHA
jgi:hypothetical protein